MLFSRTPSSVAARRVVLSIITATSLSTSVAAGDKTYNDEKFLFSLTAPQPWADAPKEAYTVPGTVRVAWSAGNQASLLAFMQEPGTAFSPRFLLDESAKAMREKLGCEIQSTEVKTVGRMKAMWLVATGKGTGGALTGQGEVETTTHWVAVPREKDIIVILLTCPAADYKKLLPSFEEAIKSLKIAGKQTTEQSEAK